MVIKVTTAYVKVDPGFKYPDEIIDYLVELNERCPIYTTKGENCETTCKEQLSRKPILNSTYFSYQINRLEK